MGVKVKGVQVDMSGVPSKINQIKTNPSLGMFAVSECARVAQPYVPEREGVLKGATGDSRPWVLVYNTPYAKAQFYGEDHVFTKATAMAHWDRGIQERAGEVARALTAKIASM